MPTRCQLASLVEERLLQRNQLCEDFFAREAGRLAAACREMSERFLRGGRLLAFGRGPYATDAQHVSVEFVHPTPPLSCGINRLVGIFSQNLPSKGVV